MRTADGGTAVFSMHSHSGTEPRAVTMASMSFQGTGAGVGLRTLSMFMGLFLILMAGQKVGWLLSSAPLLAELERWRELTSGNSLWYLETVCIPFAPLFARVVPLAEFAAGTALMVGFSVRVTAGLALLMVLNFHFASGIMFTGLGYLTNGFGPPVLGSLLALTIGGRALPFSLR